MIHDCDQLFLVVTGKAPGTDGSIVRPGYLFDMFPMRAKHTSLDGGMILDGCHLISVLINFIRVTFAPGTKGSLVNPIDSVDILRIRTHHSCLVCDYVMHNGRHLLSVLVNIICVALILINSIHSIDPNLISIHHVHLVHALMLDGRYLDSIHVDVVRVGGIGGTVSVRATNVVILVGNP